MSPSSRVQYLAALLALGCAVFPGCERKPATPSAEQTIALLQWTNQLEHYRGQVLTGSWEHAESAWAKLNKNQYTAEEIKRWIQFQTEILEQTKDDALKTPLRHCAMQQLYWHPEASRPYLGWIKGGLATNLFSDSITIQKARETVEELEKIGK